MTWLVLMVFLLVSALVNLLGWPPKTNWQYVPSAACALLTPFFRC